MCVKTKDLGLSEKFSFRRRPRWCQRAVFAMNVFLLPSPPYKGLSIVTSWRSSTLRTFLSLPHESVPPKRTQRILQLLFAARHTYDLGSNKIRILQNSDYGSAKYASYAARSGFNVTNFANRMQNSILKVLIEIRFNSNYLIKNDNLYTYITKHLFMTIDKWYLY